MEVTREKFAPSVPAHKKEYVFWKLADNLHMYFAGDTFNPDKATRYTSAENGPAGMVSMHVDDARERAIFFGDSGEVVFWTREVAITHLTGRGYDKAIYQPNRHLEIEDGAAGGTRRVINEWCPISGYHTEWIRHVPTRDLRQLLQKSPHFGPSTLAYQKWFFMQEIERREKYWAEQKRTEREEEFAQFADQKAAEIFAHLDASRGTKTLRTSGQAGFSTSRSACLFYLLRPSLL